MNQKLANYFKTHKEKRTQLILKLRINHTLPEIAEMLDYPDGVVMHFLMKALFELDNKRQVEYIFKKIKFNKLSKKEFKIYMLKKKKSKKISP
jgi:hypothetical protein